jgi:hypothetical protein
MNDRRLQRVLLLVLYTVDVVLGWSLLIRAWLRGEINYYLDFLHILTFDKIKKTYHSIVTLHAHTPIKLQSSY